jgi:hypothetical protein
MPAAALPPDLRAAAPGLAGRFVLIMASLVAVIARRYLRMPRRVALIVPLCAYLARAGRRFERLAARLAARKLRPGRPGRPIPARPAPASRAYVSRARAPG